MQSAFADQRLRSASYLAFCALMLMFTGCASLKPDPLPSWNEGSAKQSVVALVAKVTTPGSPDLMLQWTAAGTGSRFMGIVHHTDAAREWAYDSNSSVGKLSTSTLDIARAKGWTVVDMKRDRGVVFPFQTK